MEASLTKTLTIFTKEKSTRFELIGLHVIWSGKYMTRIIKMFKKKKKGWHKPIVSHNFRDWDTRGHLCPMYYSKSRWAKNKELGPWQN